MMERTTKARSRLAVAAALALFGCGGHQSVTELEVAVADDVTLRATYSSPGKPGPGVMLLHMCNSDRSAWNGLTPLLLERGMHVMAADYRGHGQSGGTNPQERDQALEMRHRVWPDDLDAVLAALLAQPGVEQGNIGVAGSSCGVDQAIRLAKRHQNVKTLVLLAGGTNEDGESFLAENPSLPVLGAASRDDGNAVEDLRWTLGYSSNPDNVFEELSHGGHGTEMFAKHHHLEPDIADWFEQHLVVEPITRTEPTLQPGPSLAAISALREFGGPARARQWLHSRDRVEPNPVPPEGIVNALGYEYLQAGELDLAIEVFELNTEAYPLSANTFDSLGDAWLAAGDGDRVETYARKTLELLPFDPNTNSDYRQALEAAARAKLNGTTGTRAEHT